MEVLNKNSYICKCFCRFKTEEAFRYHQCCHNSPEQNYKCPECSWGCTNWFTMRKHLWKLHNIDVEIFYCEICGFKTPLIPEFLTHKSIHEGKDFMCILCGIETSDLNKTLENDSSNTCVHSFIAFHKIFKNKNDLYSCILGDYEAQSLKLLQKHCLKHLSKNKIQCSHCNFSTFCYNNFQKHQYFHLNDKPFKCYICSSEYQNANSYKFHVKTAHTKGSFACIDCQYYFDSENHLKIHLSFHETIQEDCVSMSNISEIMADNQENPNINPITVNSEISSEHSSKELLDNSESCQLENSYNQKNNISKHLSENNYIEDMEYTDKEITEGINTDNSEKTSDSEKSEDISSKQHSNSHLGICEKESNSKDHIKSTNLDSALDCQQISSSTGLNVKIPPRNVTMNFTECKNGLIDWKIDQLESIFKDHVFMCTVIKCKCRFKTLKGLQYHHLCHDTAANFKCPQCSWISRNWQPMKKHLWESHKVDIELFTCDICGYKTPDIPKLTAHKNTHPEGILICIKCGMETIEKPELSSYDCIHYFVRKQSDESNLNYQPEIHGVSTQKNNMKNYAHFNKHKYKCKVCDYNTSTYSDFRIHQRIHFSSKLFRCSFCSEHFSDKLYYRHHLKNKHSTDKLFPCFVCNRIFLSIENLKSHASLHQTLQNEKKNDQVLEESDSQQNIHADFFFKNDQKSAIQLLTSECNLENSYVDSSQKFTVQSFSKIRLNLETSKLNQVNEPSEMNIHPPPLLKIKEEPLTDEIPNLSASVSHELPVNESTMQFDISLLSENSIKIKKEIIDEELNDFVNSNVNGLVKNSITNESLNIKANSESASNSDLLVILFDDQNNMIYNSPNDISKHLDIIPLKHRGKFTSLSENTLVTNDHDSLTSLKNIKKIKSKKQKTNSPIVKTIIDEKIAKLESMFESYKHICPVEKCNCRFKTLEGLTYHQWCHNLTENNFKCPECNSTSRNWQPMKKHLWEKHRLDVELFECDLCSYKTACIAQLTSHRHCHSEKQLNKPDPVWKSCSRIRLPKC